MSIFFVQYLHYFCKGIWLHLIPPHPPIVGKATRISVGVNQHGSVLFIGYDNLHSWSFLPDISYPGQICLWSKGTFACYMKMYLFCWHLTSCKSIVIKHPSFTPTLPFFSYLLQINDTVRNWSYIRFFWNWSLRLGKDIQKAWGKKNRSNLHRFL